MPTKNRGRYAACLHRWMLRALPGVLWLGMGTALAQATPPAAPADSPATGGAVAPEAAVLKIANRPIVTLRSESFGR
jgi:hypothetical protein